VGLIVMPALRLPPSRDRLPGLARLAGLLACTGFFTGISAHRADAQPVPAPSQVTPQNIAPQPPAVPPTLNLTGPAGAQPPPGAEQVKVSPATITVEGGYDELAATTERLTAPFRGQTHTVAELYQLAASIERAYGAAGYVLVRIVVPPQTLKDGGDFRLQIVDGFVEAMDVRAVPSAVAGPISQRLQKLVGVKHIKLPEIERAVTLAGTLPGVKLRSTLAPGQQPGGTLLIIEADYSPISGQLSSDNKLGPLFSDWELNLQLSANSLLGYGEQAYIYLSGNPDLGRAFDADARRRVAGAGVTVPIGDDGLAVTAEGTIADTKPVVPGAFFQSNGLFKRLDLRGAYPVLKSRAESLTLTGAFEYSVETEVADGFGLLVDEDRINVLRLSADWNRTLDWGAGLDVFGQFSKGVTWLNVRTISDVIAANVGFSRFGASPNFTKVEAHVSLNVGNLPLGLATTANFRGQAALDTALPSSELFALDGEDAISPLTSGTLSGDSGVAARLELVRPTPWSQFSFAPYVFVSAGQLFNKFESPTQILEANGYGAGVRLSYPAVYGLTPNLSVEGGRVNAGLASDNRVMVNLGVSF
jgi:hemolysin activation/secretion protein